jgi:CheY-like chemotaxis protein
VSNLVDLMKPEAAARLRHLLLTPLYQIIGYAEMVREEASEQNAGAEATLMEEAAEGAHRIVAMVRWALPLKSHIAQGAIPRLCAAMYPESVLILSAAARFEELTGGACAPEIDKIRQGARDLRQFSRAELPAPQAGPLTVLVVDDEEIVRRTARAMLEHKGYRVLLAADGNEALEIFRADPTGIALVLLDFAMPRMDGAEAAARLLQLRPGLPILVSSGFAATDVARRFAATPVAGYVRKPFTAAALLKGVTDALE